MNIPISIKHCAGHLWEYLGLVNVVLGIFSLGIWWASGPIIIYASLVVGSKVGGLFLLIGLLQTANVAQIIHKGMA